MKIGFIGVGNMAQGIIKGLKEADYPLFNNIQVTASTAEHTATIAKGLGVVAGKNNQTLAKEVDLLILAVKPPMVADILQEIAPVLQTKQTVIVSLAAGLTLANLKSCLTDTPQTKIIRAMPNMNITVRRSVTALCGSELVSPAEMAAVVNLFEAVGSTYQIAEKDFRNFTALAGCSPAFTYLYIDAMSRAGVKNGLPKDIATKIATEAVLGSAEMLLAATDETPWDLIDKVCSPGGTTIAGVISLEEDAFMASVIKALEATIKRDEELEH